MIVKKMMGKVKAPKQNAKIRDIARSMISEEYCHLPVVDDAGMVVGIVSEFDILKAIREGKNIDTLTAGELMSKKVVTVEENDTVDKAIDMMTTTYIITLPVVRDGKLVGVVNRRNILQSLIDHEYMEYFMTIQ